MVEKFKKIRRLKLKIASIIMLLALFTLELSPFAVKAAPQTLQYYSPGAVSVARDVKYGKDIWYSRATLGGNVAYCTDYSCKAPSGAMEFRQYVSDQGMAILINGYPNATPAQMGVDSEDEAYVATQLALWEVLNRTAESNKAGIPCRVENIQPKAGMEDFYNKTIAAARRLVSLAENNPYTDSPTMTINNANAANVNDKGDYVLLGPVTVSITGTSESSIKSITTSLSGAPASVQVVDANGNPKTNIGNNEEVYVKVAKDQETTEFNWNFSADINKRVGVIYTKKGEYVQDYVTILDEPVKLEDGFKMKWNSASGMIKIVKVDQYDEPVAGAEFHLTRDGDNADMGNFTTGTDGEVKIYGLKPGTYTLTETKAPQGYAIRETSKNIKVNVEADKTAEVPVVNDKQSGKIVVTKVDDANHPIANVTFEIIDSEKYVVDKITTDASGKATTKDLPIGTYYYREVSTPEGYISNDTVYKLDLTANQIFYTPAVVNKRMTGTVAVLKTDAETKQPIAGVKFNIIDEDGKVVNTMTTNAKGQAGITDLPYGKYTIKEVEAPSEYVVNYVESFEINSATPVILKPTNDKIKGKLKIEKIDGTTKLALAGAKFDVLDSDKKVVDTITTDELGYAYSKELTPGKYYFKEVKAPEGYILNSTETSFEIVETEGVTKTVTNDKATARVRIIKVDDLGRPLAGVEFDVLDENNNVVDHLITNSEGAVESKELPLGKYFYKETKAPEEVDPASYVSGEFVLTEAQITKPLIRSEKNKLKREKIRIIKVDENEKPLEGVTFEIYDKDKKLIDEIVTDKEGKAISTKDLEKGTYYVKETKAPEGIKVDDTMHEVEITTDGQNVTKDLNIVNYYVKGQLKIYKMIEGTSTPLAGAVFEITNEKGEVVDTITSVEDGVAMSKALPYGTYYFMETKAPDGYKRDENEYMFKVEEDGQVIETVIYNAEELIPKTGGAMSSDMAIVLVVAMISVAGYGIMKVLSLKKED